MFAKILAWIKEIFSKMIGQQSVKQALNIDVAISNEMMTALETWSLMYANQAGWLNKDIKSLNLPAAIASEIARAVTIEMSVELTGSARAAFLQKQLTPVLSKLREKVEVGAAKGGLIFKPYISGKEIAVDYIHADMFYPVAFDSNGNITSCVFADQQTIGGKYYTRLEFHRMTPQGCEITNRAFQSDSRDTLGKSVDLSTVAIWAELLPEATITGIDRPLFAYFKYPLANTVDPTSPLGVSCYSRAVDLIHDADIQWSNLIWEFESGQRALYVDALAFGKDSTGKAVLPNKRLYKTIDAGGQEDALFKEWTPTLREENILKGLDAILKRVEFACGLAYGTLSDPNTIEKTATEIAASKQRTQSTIVDTQKALQEALDHLLYAIDIWATLGNLAPRGTYAVAYDFDDSLLVDSEMQFAQDTRTVGLGAMPLYMFLMRNYGLTEQLAKQWITEKQAETPADMFADQGA
jgi:A118 family predicted phage portal protein